jgi:uncharacterized protein (TIGR00290 family)
MMGASMHDAAVLWTGGKDSALALDEAARSGWRIRCLATFAPPEPEFLSHPIAVMQRQAKALGLSHHILTVDAPFEQGYEAKLRRLRDAMHVECVVTGDIAEVSGCPSWVRERAFAVGMDVHTPLWGRDRTALLQQLLDRGFDAVISCVDTRRLDAAWVGRKLDAVAIAELGVLHQRTGIDACGENGEYHTLTLDGPGFAQRIDIGAFSIRTFGDLAHLQFHDT